MSAFSRFWWRWRHFNDNFVIRPGNITPNGTHPALSSNSFLFAVPSLDRRESDFSPDFPDLIQHLVELLRALGNETHTHTRWLSQISFDIFYPNIATDCLFTSHAQPPFASRRMHRGQEVLRRCYPGETCSEYQVFNFDTHYLKAGEITGFVWQHCIVPLCKCEYLKKDCPYPRGSFFGEWVFWSSCPAKQEWGRLLSQARLQEVPDPPSPCD